MDSTGLPSPWSWQRVQAASPASVRSAAVSGEADCASVDAPHRRTPASSMRIAASVRADNDEMRARAIRFSRSVFGAALERQDPHHQVVQLGLVFHLDLLVLLFMPVGKLHLVAGG